MPADDRVFLDTTVLSNFASTDSVWLIPAVFDRPVAPREVYQELEQGINEGYQYLTNATAVCVVPQIHQRTAESGEIEVPELGSFFESNAKSILDELDRGEAAAVHQARTFGGTVATDDKDARNFADEHGVAYTGSIGVLVRGVHFDEIDVSTADEWLSEWIDRGYRSPVDSIQPIIDSL